jgi:hypothetical protein
MIMKILQTLWILLTLFYLTGCNFQEILSSPPINGATEIPMTPQPVTQIVKTTEISQNSAMETITTYVPIPTAIIEPSSSTSQAPPVTLVSLNGQILEFKCLEGSNCIPNIDLSQHILLEQPYVLDTVLYWDPANVYAMLYSTDSASPFKRIVMHINSQTGAIKSTEVPKQLSDVPFHIVSAIAEGRLILTNYAYDTVYILDDDLSIIEIKIDVGAESLIETNSQEVIALSKIPIEKERSAFLRIALIDVISGQATNKLLDIPMLDITNPQAIKQGRKMNLVRIEGISTDLKQIYARYTVSDKPEILRLGTIDIQSTTDVASIDDPWLTNIAADYTQYRDMLYRSYFPCSECSGPGAQLINMSTITPLITTEQLKAASGKKFEVAPFGQFFLLETNGQITLLSPNGDVIKTYSVPEAWADRNYQFVQYRR